MARSYSTTSSSKQHITDFECDNEVVLCHCGYIARFWTSWKETNPNRRFYSCQERGCLFFLWLDHEMSARAKVVINELEWENKLLKIEIKDMQEVKGRNGEWMDEVK